MKRNRYFQWIAGENQGVITSLNNITEYDGEYFYNFNDGESCNQRFVAKMTTSPNDIKNKFVVEIISPNDPWKIETIKSKTYTDAQTQERVEVPALDDIAKASGTGQSLSIDKSHVGEVKYIAPNYRGPMYELPSLDEWMVDNTLTPKRDNVVFKEQDKSAVYVSPKNVRREIVSNEQPVQESKVQNTIIKEDIPDTMKPIKILIDKCKRKPIDVNMNITLNVPSVNVFNIANDDFENGGELFIEYVVDNIDVTDIKNSLKDALLNEYTKMTNI